MNAMLHYRTCLLSHFVRKNLELKESLNAALFFSPWKQSEHMPCKRNTIVKIKVYSPADDHQERRGTAIQPAEIRESSRFFTLEKSLARQKCL